MSQAATGSRRPSLFDEHKPVPFEDLLEPAVRVARQRLQFQCAHYRHRTGEDPLALLSEAAARQLEQSLLRRLAALAAEPLYVEFCRARNYGKMLVGLLSEHAADVAGVEDYERFVERTREDGLLGFFRRYPVVARLLATAVEQWADCNAELLQRLCADAEAIEEGLFPEADCAATSDPGAFVVAAVTSSQSDAHRGGRAVAILTLRDGRKLVYKPKCLSLEVALNDFLAWCNDANPGETLRVVRVLDRGDYGWAEWVEHAPCGDLDEAQRFYRRAGMLLCVLHVLRATDCHHGNLIASGEHPVLVDAETLVHPEVRPIEEDFGWREPDPITRDFAGSVLRTLLLPAWHVSGDGQVAYDISGLGGTGGDPLAQKVPEWRWINTDVMVMRYRDATVPAEKNVVRVGEQILDPTDFEPKIVAGFQQMYRQLVELRHSLLSERSPLTAMRELPIRSLFRPTRVYVSVLMNACAPQHLTSGARFSVELDHLSRTFVDCPSRPRSWPLLDAELKALGQLDVPYFEGRANREALELGDGRIVPRYFRRAGYVDVLAQAARLGDDDLRWQLAVIKGSFQARLARNVRQVGGGSDTQPARRLGPVEMMREAEQLALELERRGISDENGETNWLGLNIASETERVQLRLIGDALYEGRCGVALFLAALHSLSGSSRLGRLVRAALLSVQRLSDAASENPQASAGVAGMPGAAAIGSMIYALVKIGGFLNDPEQLERASGLATLMTPEAAARDDAFDILAGSAGAILGLVELHRATGDPDQLEAARAFGIHLLAHRVGHRGAPRAWLTMGTRPLAGFSHGAAGIAYALLRLYEACGEHRFRVAALEAIEYERTLFSPADSNWPDLREADEDNHGVFPDQWCHGAAGIALARLGSRRVVPDPSLDAEVDSALRTTQNAGLKAVDHLCCGNAGRIEALWVGAHQMKRVDWHDAALSYASQMAARARRIGTYQLFPNLPCDVFNPGLFRGVAGIGYQWLRLASPQLPSVLLWD